MDFKDIKKEAKHLLNESVGQIDDIRMCCDCFYNRDQPNAVEMVCAKPHLPLWVRYGYHPWWPAKLLNVGKGKCPLEVQFFGEFSSASVTYTDCLLYSYGDPNIWCFDLKKEKFNQAIDVN